MHNYFSAIVPITASEKSIKTAVVNNCSDEWNGESQCYMSEIAARMSVNIVRGCYTEKEAKDMLGDSDDFYWGQYIKAIPFCRPKNSKKLADFDRRIMETKKKYTDYIEAHRVADYKAEFIGCPKCKSKIAKFYFERNRNCVTDRCPVCHEDMASDTTKKTLKGYLDKIEKLEKEKEAEIKKSSDKPTHYFAICGIHS